MSAILQDISEKLQKGKMKEVAELVKQAVADGIQPLTILNEGLMPGMDIIGERFKKNDIFIPEVLIAARAMAAGTDVLRPLLVGDQMEEKGTVVIGTIKDDLHDIGKNLVRMMMESKGLNVIDLGNSVPPAKYIEAAAKHNADIIACSALLTTTMVHIKDVVKGVAESPLAGKVKIMIGGAPVNDAFRESIGADYYTRRLLSRGKGPRNLRRREGVEKHYGNRGRGQPFFRRVAPLPGPFHLPRRLTGGEAARKKPLRMEGMERRRNGNPAAGEHGKEAARLSHASRRKAAPPTQTAPATPPPGGKETDMHLIACEVFRPELERLTRAMRNAPEVTYLEQGLHDTPDELRRRVQQAVDALEAKGETVIFLAYGLCGCGLTGVTGHTATLILPRVHDCIPVLLGATQEQANESSLGGGTYWLSPGWLRYSQTSFIQNREKRFKEYEERFGTDSAAYLIELEGSWLRNYTNACLILWEGWEDERELVRTAKAVADDAGLGYRELPGDPNFIQALLDGGKDGRFMRIAPGFTPDLDGNGTITAVRVTS